MRFNQFGKNHIFIFPLIFPVKSLLLTKYVFSVVYFTLLDKGAIFSDIKILIFTNTKFVFDKPRIAAKLLLKWHPNYRHSQKTSKVIPNCYFLWIALFTLGIIIRTIKTCWSNPKKSFWFVFCLKPEKVPKRKRKQLPFLLGLVDYIETQGSDDRISLYQIMRSKVF